MKRNVKRPLRAHNGRVDRVNGSVIEVEESLLPRARDLHQQLEAHLRGLGLAPVSFEPARHGNARGGSSTDREAAAVPQQPPVSVEPAQHGNGRSGSSIGREAAALSEQPPASVGPAPHSSSGNS